MLHVGAPLVGARKKAKRKRGGIVRNRKERMLLIGGVVCIVVAAIIYYYNNIKIPQIKEVVENEIRREIDIMAMPTERIFVVKSEKGIDKNTKMSSEIIEEHFEIVEVPTKFVARHATGNIEDIIGKLSKQNLTSGQQIIADFFVTLENKRGDFQRLKEYSVVNLVDGKVKAGNYVDIVVDYGNGDYDIVVSNIKIVSISDKEKADQKSKEYVIVLAVDEIQFRDLALASKLGELTTRLYIDNEQKSSNVTFNHELAMEELLIDVESKISQDEGE